MRSVRGCADRRSADAAGGGLKAKVDWPGSGSAGCARQRQSQRRPAVTLVSRSGHGRRRGSPFAGSGVEGSSRGRRVIMRDQRSKTRRFLELVEKVLQCGCGFEGHVATRRDSSGGLAARVGGTSHDAVARRGPRARASRGAARAPADCDCSHDNNSEAKGEA
jgi:hypothetical protein